MTRRAARADLCYFSEYLGYKNAPFHRQWYELLQPQNDPQHFSPFRCHPSALKKYHLEAPRKHAKSECTSINYPSWLIGNDPDIHILIISETGTLAGQTSAAVKRRIEGQGKEGTRYVEVFGDLTPGKEQTWTDTTFTVKRRTESKFPTLRATGLLGSVTGGGFDLIIADDIISAKTVLTRNQIEKTRQWFFEVLQTTLFPWGAIFVIGTRWHHTDLYGELIKPIIDGGKGWKHQVLRAIMNEEEISKGEQPRVLWEDYWPYAKLMEKKAEIGSLWFNCQYQNDPTSLAGDLLKGDWLQPYDILPNDLIYYGGLDPSRGEGDLLSLSTLGLDRRHKTGYLIEVLAENMPVGDFLRLVKQKDAIYHYAKVFVESNSMQGVILQLPEATGLPTVETVTDKNKERRFTTMSSHFEAGRILVNPALKNPTCEFFNEWVQFPRGGHDDALDSTEIVVRNAMTAPDVDGFIIG